MAGSESPADQSLGVAERRPRPPALLRYLETRAAWQDPFRREGNERGTKADLLAWRVVAVLLMALAVGRSWTQLGLLGVALAQASYALLALGLAALIKHRREVYVRHRELILTGAAIHCSLITIYGTIHVGSRIFAQHGGSPLRLLGLLLVMTPSPWLALYILSGNLVLSWNYLALPLVALPSLLGGDAVCEPLVHTPGAKALLASLHQLLGIVHSGCGAPAGLIVASGAGHSPMQHCTSINAWASLLCIVALPLFVQRRTEPAARRLHAQRRRRQQRQVLQAGQRQTAAALPSGSSWRQEQQQQQQLQEDEQERERQQQEPVGPWLPTRLLEFYLTSCLVWCASQAVQLLLPNSSSSSSSAAPA